MDRHLWTEADVKAARREWAVTTFNLADPVVLPYHLRDASRDHWRTPSAPRRRGKHAASDEEGSRVLLRVDLVTVVKVAAVAGLLIVGVRVVRSLLP